MKRTTYRVKIGARDLWNLAYGQHKILTFVTVDHAIEISLATEALPSDEFELVNILRRAKGR